MITVDITRKGITDVDAYTPAAIDEKYGITAAQIIDMKGFMGDTRIISQACQESAKKQPLKLLKEFETVENVLKSIDQVSGKKLKEKLEENRESAIMSKKLATIDCEAPIEVSVEDAKYEGMNLQRSSHYLKSLGLILCLLSLVNQQKRKQNLKN